MASDVDICRMAIGNLGDSANIASISPPDGSVQADLCAIYYPMARDTLLEMHAWNFAVRRQQLAQLTAETDAYLYSYAMPSNCIRVLSVLPDGGGESPGEPIPFSCEVDGSGNAVILTDQESAACKYIVRITETSRFSPAFVESLGWLLAAMLAGPLIKGDSGAKMAQTCRAMAQAVASRAAAADANQRQVKPNHNVSWISGR